MQQRQAALEKNAVRYLIIQIEMRSISTFFYALKKFKWSQVSNQAALHCIGIISDRGKILLKIKCTEYLKNKSKQVGDCFWLAIPYLVLLKRKKCSTQFTTHFTNVYECRKLKLLHSFDHKVKLPIYLCFRFHQAQAVIVVRFESSSFFSFICNVSGISSRVFMAKNDVDVCAMQCESWKWWMKKRRNMKNSMKWKPFNMNDVILLKFQLRCLDKCDSMNFPEKIELNLINDVTSQFIWNKEVMDQNGIFNRKQKSYDSLGI